MNSFLQSKNALMFITALLFMTGILAYFNDCGILCAIIFSIASIFLIIKNYVSIKYILFWIIIFYFGFFNAYFRIHTTDSLLTLAPADAKIEGQIISIPDNSSDEKIKFFFDVYNINGKKLKGKTLVTLSGENLYSYKIGNNYELTGKLRKPFYSSNPSQFDYGKYLRNFNTYTVFYSDNASPLKTELHSKWKFLQKLNNLRDRIINVHAQYLRSPNLEILGGIVFGDDAVSPPEYIKASFINSGLLHILAASGMNVAFIYGFWVFFLRRIRIPFKLTVITGMGVVIIYTMMTGLGASVIRAALMLLFVLIGKLIDRDAHSVSLLALVAMLMLIYDPAFINNVGFQLSFIVTFGILTTANVIFEKYKNLPVPNWMTGAVLIPIVAQIWVAPIQMFYFNTFSTYSVFANILSMPFLSVVSFGGFLSSIIAMFTPYTDKICMITDFILNAFLDVIVNISEFFAGLTGSMITTSHPSVFQIIVYYCVILALTLAIKTGVSKKLVISCVALLLLLSASLINIPNNNLEIISFDVQNADCFLVKTPQNKYFIIDTGRSGYKGGKSQANSIIIKYLKDRGIKNIEGLIITHFDNDHSGGAEDIMKTLKVKNVYINSYDNKSITSKYIYKTIKELKISAQIPENNKSIYKEENFNIQTYISNTAQTDNEKSIITLVSYNDFDMLFTGDAGVEAFNTVKKNIPHKIEVLKVGHHGGYNVVNNNMLEHLNTKVSIISTGLNVYGHPNAGTLDTLRYTDIFRTDRHNAIKINTDGKIYKVSTYIPDKQKFELSKKYETLE